LVTASVGDSRIYLVREGRIIQLTTDHTWVQEAIENGLLTEEQAAQHPNIHVIRRYLGSKDTVEPELRLHLAESAKKSAETTEPGIKLLPGDRLIVCTDGLTDLVKDQEILSTLAGQTMNQALGQLVNLANQRGGHDNITIIAIQVPGNGEAAASAGLPARRSKVLAGCLGAVAALIFALLMITGVLWWGTRSGDLSTSTSTLAAPAQTPPGVVPSAIPSVFPETPSVAPTPTYMPIMLETMTGPPGSTLTPWPTNTAYP
jgi:protein phosphatase